MEKVTANVEEKVRELELDKESEFEWTLKSPDETFMDEEGVAFARQGKRSDTWLTPGADEGNTAEVTTKDVGRNRKQQNNFILQLKRKMYNG